MPNGLYRQTSRGKTENWPIERIHREKIDSNGKPEFSVVYATRIEFLRITGGRVQISVGPLGSGCPINDNSATLDLVIN